MKGVDGSSNALVNWLVIVCRAGRKTARNSELEDDGTLKLQLPLCSLMGAISVQLVKPEDRCSTHT